MEKQILELINGFSKLPGVGQKLAEKIVCYSNKEMINNLKKMLEVFDKMQNCQKCNGFTQNKICDVCLDKNRNNYQICVVSSIVDFFQLEEKNFFKGKYYILNQEINPKKGIAPQDLNLDKLKKQVNEKTELMIATNFTIEGELTAKYIVSYFKDKVKKIFRPSTGIPVGSKISYVDNETLKASFNNKKEV